MRKGTSNGAEPASTLHQHAAQIKERRRTSAGTKTVCSFCNTGAKHRSDRCPLKTAIGNHIKVDNQQALDSVTEKLGMHPEQQDLQIVAWMQQNQDITKAYIHCMQNCPVWKEFYSENTKPNLMKMAYCLCGFWKSGEWKLIMLSPFVFVGKTYDEPPIAEAHVATSHVGLEQTMACLTDRYQS